MICHVINHMIVKLICHVICHDVTWRRVDVLTLMKTFWTRDKFYQTPPQDTINIGSNQNFLSQNVSLLLEWLLQWLLQWLLEWLQWLLQWLIDAMIAAMTAMIAAMTAMTLAMIAAMTAAMTASGMTAAIFWGPTDPMAYFYWPSNFGQLTQ